MRVYFISPQNYLSPLLFSTMVEPFEQQGHQIVSDIKEADVVFLDLHNRIGHYNLADFAVIFNKKIPTVIFDFWDYGGTIDETSQWIGKNDWEYLRSIHGQAWASALRMLIANEIKLIFFVRKMDKTETYDQNVYPIELIMYPDCNFEPTTKEELFSRQNDICFIGNSSPSRNKVCTELMKYFKCDFILGQQRLPHNEWLERHTKAKFFLESCGGGFGSERPYQLITIAPMIKQRNNHLQQHPFGGFINCVDVEEYPKDFELKILQDYLNDADILYKTYINGIAHMKKYYNAEYRSLYILKILLDHGIN